MKPILFKLGSAGQIASVARTIIVGGEKIESSYSITYCLFSFIVSNKVIFIYYTSQEKYIKVYSNETQQNLILT